MPARRDGCLDSPQMPQNEEKTPCRPISWLLPIVPEYGRIRIETYASQIKQAYLVRLIKPEHYKYKQESQNKTKYTKTTGVHMQEILHSQKTNREIEQKHNNSNNHELSKESLRNPAQRGSDQFSDPIQKNSSPRNSAQSPDHIIVRGARVHNLKNIDVDIPLGRLVAIAGVSGSGKSSLALGTLYAEGSRRYLEALSTYTRRRITQAGKAEVDEIRHVPAALALHQRPGIPGVRSTFGTASELLNSLRLMFSRLGSHCCPNGHHCPPSMDVALMLPTKCPTCSEEFYGPGAEEMAFNSEGACPTCSGTGIVRTVDESKLVPDDSLTIDEGAVAPWQTLMWSLMKDVCREMGVRTDVPFRDLTPEEKEIVFHGAPEKKHILYVNEKTNTAGEMDFTYYSAVYTVENALSKVKDEKGMKRVEKFLHEAACPDCAGTRLSKKVRATTLAGKNLAEATAMTLSELMPWVQAVPETLPEELRPMAESIIQSFTDNAKRLLDLGLGYLSLDRASSTLSTGERQRVQLARAVRNETTGVLYVLDEPSIGLHPSNIEGLMGVVDSLIADGNSVVLVDHDVHVLQHADHMIELGPLAGTQGGTILAQGSIPEIIATPGSKIAPFLQDDNELTEGNDQSAQSVPFLQDDIELTEGNTQSTQNAPFLQDETKSIDVQSHMSEESLNESALRINPNVLTRKRAKKEELFDLGTILMETESIHTVHELTVKVPKGRLTVVTGVSGSGKTTMVLESLIPGVTAYYKWKDEIIGTESAIVGSENKASVTESTIPEAEKADTRPENQNNDSLIPNLPYPVKRIEAEGINRANLIDASPIGINIRSTVATYSGVLDDLRKLYAGTEAAKSKKLKAGAFSYNTGKLRCPTCDGTGQISLDVQFLPDVTIKCPDCGGKRYAEEAEEIRWTPHSGSNADNNTKAADHAAGNTKTTDRDVANKKAADHAAGNTKTADRDIINKNTFSLPDLMAMTVDDALEVLRDNKKIAGKLQILHDLGLGYLTLGEDTPALSGGEAQRLKLASEMRRTQDDSIFVFDEPTIGLHPLDVQVLLSVFDHLVEAGATVIVIEHDLDVIANADYIIDMGPGGGEQGGRIVACGTPEDIRECAESVTGRYL